MTVPGLSVISKSRSASQSRSGSVTVAKSLAARSHGGPSMANFRRILRITSRCVVSGLLTPHFDAAWLVGPAHVQSIRPPRRLASKQDQRGDWCSRRGDHWRRPAPATVER